jgi:uncharacterized protein YjbI with pentapeptide repeats
MSSPAPPIAILLTPSALASGVAWVTTTAAGAELGVVGKLEFAFTTEGDPRPVQAEAPGHWQGRPSPEELELSQARRLLVRGQRPLPGRVVLRRGTTSIAELELGAGGAPAVGQLASASMSTVVGTPGDEWLVVEGFDGPRSRRWCKLPRVGLLAVWQSGAAPPERLLLGSRQCFVDVARQSFAFVLRATRRLSTGAIPQRVELVVTNLAPMVTVAATTTDLGTTLPLDAGRAAVVAPVLPFPVATGAPASPNASAPRLAGQLPFAAPVAPPPKLPVIGRGLPFLGEAPSETTATGVSTTNVMRADELAGEGVRRALPFTSEPELDDTRSLGADELPPRESVLPFASSEPAPVVPATPPVMPPPRVPVPMASPDTESEIATLPIHGGVRAPESLRRAAEQLAVPVATSSPSVNEAPEFDPVRSELDKRLRDGAALAGLELRSADLSGLVLRHAKLGGLDLSLANLSSADLTSADLTRTKLDGARLDGAKLDGAILARASFEGASLERASLRDVQARECNLVEAQLSGCDLTGADLRRAKLVGAKLVGAQGTKLNGLESDWTGADLGDAKLDGANLRGAVLKRASLRGASFDGADLRDADLREATPAEALEGAKLAGARKG